MTDVEPKRDGLTEVDAIRRVGEVCKRFEADWRADHSRRIGAYIGGVEPCYLDRLVRSLMASEIELCAENGEGPSVRGIPNSAIPSGLRWSRRYSPTANERPCKSKLSSGSRPSPQRSPRTTEIEPAAGSVDDAGASITTVLPFVAPPRHEAEDRLPERFGRYTVTGLLGKGGFGTVYLARDDELHRKVAIKVPRPGLLSSAQQVESFIAEGRITAVLGHPSIVAVHDIGRHGETGVFVVFEYIKGAAWRTSSTPRCFPPRESSE